jgi:hypothetical protein
MATYYWYNGSGDWNAGSTANWSTSATNPRASFPAPSAPTSVDNVVFDNLSGTGTINCFGPVCNNFTTSSVSSSLLFGGSFADIGISIYGNISLGTGATTDSGKYFNFTCYSSTAGKTIAFPSTIKCGQIWFFDTSGTGSAAWTTSGAIDVTAATPAFGIFVVSGCSVTFGGAVSASSITNGGTLTTGAFTHTITDSITNAPKFYLQSGSTTNLTNTTLNIGTSGVVSTATWRFEGASITTTSSTINVGNASCVSADIQAGNATYNIFNITSQETYLTGNNTFSTLTVTGGTSSESIFNFYSQTITNVLTLQGNSIAPYRLLVAPLLIGGISESPPTATLTLSGAGAKTLKWADFQDVTMNITSGPGLSIISVGDCFGNTGITFTPAVTRFAVSGGVSKNFSSTTLWSASSGGATGATSPLPQDTVIFDSNANAEVVFDMPRIGKDVTFNTGVGFSANVFAISYFYIFGTPNAEALNNLVRIYLESRSSILVPSCSVAYLTLNGYGGTYTSSGPITATTQFAPIHGSFYSSGQSVTAGTINQTVGTSSASWYASTSNITVNNNFQFFTVGTTSFASSTIVINTTNSSPQPNRLGLYSGATLGTVIFSSSISVTNTVDLNISIGTATIAKLVNSGTTKKYFGFLSGGTITIDTLEISGSQSSPVLFGTSTFASNTTAQTINLTNSVITSFVAFCNITKTGAGTLNATGVANLGRNTGITFPSTLYGIAYGGSVGSSTSGSFTVPSDFSGSSMFVVVGGGGGGARRSVTTGSAAGGGAGALAISSNPPVNAGQTIYFNAGAGGAGGTSSAGQSGSSGLSSWMNRVSNVPPSSSVQGASAAGGSGASLSSTTGATGGSITVGTFGASGGAGGSGVAATTAGSGGGGSAPRLFTTITTGFQGLGGASSNSGGAGGGGYGGIGGLASTTTGGLGGLNSLGAQASGGTAGNPGSNGTSGGGGGGGGGATTGTAGAGGTSFFSPDFVVTEFGGVPVSSTIGPSGGGGGGGTATSTGTGGAGGSALYGAGGGGGGRGNTLATNGSGGNGGPGFVLFVYTVSTTTPKSQGSIIG